MSNKTDKNAARTGEEPSPTRLAISLGRMLLEFGRDYERRVIELLQERGHPQIRPSHATVFANLSQGAVRVTELAERAHVTQQAMGKMLKEMERIGYIVRDIDGADRRAKKIRPTQRGLDLMRDSVDAVREVHEFYAAQVGEDALRDLEKSLGDCLKNIHLSAVGDDWKKRSEVA
ncbi:MAG: MarR family winged helix-turn-helix transcriptional regulator [Halieaceae bacterium]|jgi:DNA-binding MarR family transcriptional regulator|nr:MarR family winged helix-turn-helix transcriptional regulator [Halieaceae bacterium]